MALPLIPTYVADSIYDLTPQLLREKGIKLVLADLDNTLAPYEEALPSPRLVAWKESLAQAGIPLFVVSNSRKSLRCPRFCKALGIGCVRHAGKPGRKGYLEALNRHGLAPWQAIMVGDQIFTDTWGANRVGIPTVLVRPMAWGKNPFRRVRYAMEIPFRSAARTRHFS